MEGNQMKMREVLDFIADEAEVIEAYFKRENAPQCLITSVSNIINLARGCRSIPLRQCDVGTPEEQYRRWMRFCDQRLHRCANCPCNSTSGCTFTFENMPYEVE